MIKALTNKHTIIAIIVAPILAFIAYYAVDYAVSEKPHEAVEGQSYPLVAKSNCRYESGQCTFKNGDISIHIETTQVDNSELSFSLESNQPIQGSRLALANDAVKTSPISMTATDDTQVNWNITLPNTLSETSRLQLALKIKGSIYFGETGTVFTTYKTSFSQENIN